MIFSKALNRSIIKAVRRFDFHLEQSLDVDVLLPALRKNLKRRKACEMDVDICSTNRTFGTILGSEMTRSLAKGETLDEDLITVRGAWRCRTVLWRVHSARAPPGMLKAMPTITLEKVFLAVRWPFIRQKFPALNRKKM